MSSVTPLATTDASASDDGELESDLSGSQSCKRHRGFLICFAICLLGVSSVLAWRFWHPQPVPQPPARSTAALQEIVVRYAVMGNISQSGQPGRYHIRTSQLQYLAASMCSVEKYLRPMLTAVSITYLLYVDNDSEPILKPWLAKQKKASIRSARLVNLDTDPGEPQRLAKVKSMIESLNPKNLYSVRRYLADMVFMPAASGKLMIGTDFEFVNPPDELVEGILDGRTSTMFYMFDAWNKWHVNSFNGPQCEGLIGDMYYISPGQPFDLTKALTFMDFYAQLPIVANRTTPPCQVCVDESNGMHAWDQFAAQMYYASWTNGSCSTLSSKYHDAGGGAISDVSQLVQWEGLHSKGVVPCEF